MVIWLCSMVIGLVRSYKREWNYPRTIWASNPNPDNETSLLYFDMNDEYLIDDLQPSRSFHYILKRDVSAQLSNRIPYFDSTTNKTGNLTVEVTISSPITNYHSTNASYGTWEFFDVNSFLIVDEEVYSIHKLS